MAAKNGEEVLETRMSRLWNLAHLRFLLDEHQTLIYDNIRAWEARALDDPAPGEKRGMARVHVSLCGRQVGKTFTHCVIRGEDCMRTPGGLFRYACPLYKDITEIVIPNMHAVFESCPAHMRPEYRGSSRGMHEGFYFPNGAVLRLVGLDRNPRGLVGRTCDGDTISEARDLPNLDRIVGSVLYPQYQRRPKARLHIETSAPEDPDHVLDTKFIPDAKRRGAYIELTIDDNLALDEETKAEFLEAAYEIDPVSADLEYRNKRTRDGKLVVFPEFDRDIHCLSEYELPAHALALVSYDPGQKHYFGINWSVYDYQKAEVVFVDDWCEHNASTEKVAAITAAREYDLFGTLPPVELARLSLQEWEDLLGNDRAKVHAEVLHELSNERDTDELSQLKWYDNEARQWRYNPHLRVSDTALQFIRDMGVMFGLYIDPTTKDDLREVMVQLTRSKLKQGQVKFGPLAKSTAAHMSACKWDKNRRKWLEHDSYSHYDLAACVVYALRYWDSYYWIDPYPPKTLNRRGENWVGDVRVAPEPVAWGDHW